ncbi:unnamed protein product [Brassicogethes aeneus]|uniref:Breast cancer metastasis-suppressor 1-like protein n=1 Tax=Brassicogethes aeneus TaxID=1431903 RepID=A0A9P0BD43_BRAAE|nr:unnamed protein product [Brassicogethes aeneus]
MPPIKVTSSGVDVNDGDVSGAESEHSNTSRENDGARDTSEDEADSDDSSEMDEGNVTSKGRKSFSTSGLFVGECESRRTELLQHVHDLENQFGHLKEQLYKERITQVEHQLYEVKAGRSPEYLVPLSELQDNMRIRTEVADILRRLKLENIKNQFDAEEQAAKQNFESEKNLARDFYHTELLDTIRRLEEDRQNSEITWGEGGEWGTRSRSRSKRKAVTVSGPYIVYMLKPQDIIEDWTVIRKALKRTS